MISRKRIYKINLQKILNCKKAMKIYCKASMEYQVVREMTQNY